jgi:hypothetical protein
MNKTFVYQVDNNKKVRSVFIVQTRVAVRHTLTTVLSVTKQSFYDEFMPPAPKNDVFLQCKMHDIFVPF